MGVRRDVVAHGETMNTIRPLAPKFSVNDLNIPSSAEREEFHIRTPRAGRKGSAVSVSALPYVLDASWMRPGGNIASWTVADGDGKH